MALREVTTGPGPAAAQPAATNGTAGGGPSGRRAHTAITAATTLTELTRAVDAARAQEMAGHDELLLAAAVLSRRLRNASKLPGGVDKLVAARRLRKAALRAAAAKYDAARSLTAIVRSLTASTGGDAEKRRRPAVRRDVFHVDK